MGMFQSGKSLLLAVFSLSRPPPQTARETKTRQGTTASTNKDYSHGCARANTAHALPIWLQSNTAKARRTSSCFLMRNA